MTSMLWKVQGAEQAVHAHLLHAGRHHHGAQRARRLQSAGWWPKRFGYIHAMHYTNRIIIPVCLCEILSDNSDVYEFKNRFSDLFQDIKSNNLNKSGDIDWYLSTPRYCKYNPVWFLIKYYRPFTFLDGTTYNTRIFFISYFNWKNIKEIRQ